MKRFWMIFGTLAALLVLVLGAGFLSGCHAPTTSTQSASKITTPELVRDVQDKVVELEGQQDTFQKEVIDKMPAGPEKDRVLAFWMPQPMTTQQILNKLGLTAKSVAADTKHTQKVEGENTALKANDKSVAGLRFWGIAFIIAGISLVVLSFFSASLLTVPVIGWILTKLGKFTFEGGLGIAAVGVLMLTLARFLHVFEDIFFWTILGGAAVGLILAGIKLYRMWKNGGLVPGFLTLVNTPPKSLVATPPSAAAPPAPPSG